MGRNERAKTGTTDSEGIQAFLPVGLSRLPEEGETESERRKEREASSP